MHTTVSERVGVDCSCFSLGEQHFSTRTCAEKMLWLRAISNVKVKLRHWASNPSASDLQNYRGSVLEQARSLPRPVENDQTRGPLLPRRACISGPRQAPLASARAASNGTHGLV